MNGLMCTVLKNLHKIISYALLSVASIVFLPEAALPQYRVSGVVEFTYHGTKTKTGDTVTVDDQYWTQYYRVNLQGHLWDPRFMRFNGGVGYSVYSYLNTLSNGSDNDNLDYNISTTFFPGKKISWDFFGTERIENVESSGSIAGYDVTQSSYGGTLRLNLGKKGKGNNNNNSGITAHFPDITLSRIHTESESLSITSPLSEIRDDTRASFYYGANSAFTFSLDGNVEDYEDLANGSTYENKTANLFSTIRIAPDADLRLDGHFTDRQTDSIAGYLSDETTQDYSMTLDFKKKDGFRHYYRYKFYNRLDTTSEHSTHRAEARVIYDISKELELHGGLDYTLSDYTSTTEDQTYINGGLNGGLRYAKKYAPAFLGPFVIETGYELGAGFTDLSDKLDPSKDGRGRFYTNSVNLGLRSEAWRKDNLVLSYGFNNKRDHSPVANNYWQHAYRLVLDTRRLPRTLIRGTVSYTSLDNKYEEGGIFQPLPDRNLNEKRRSSLYDLTVDHIVSSYIGLTAGASRGQDSSTAYTLSTLPTTAVSEDDLYYVMANISYPISRRLRYRAQLREELRITEAADTQNHQVNMFLDYRIRRIFVKFEYRWRQDIPENTGRSEQSYYYAKLSRPF